MSAAAFKITNIDTDTQIKKPNLDKNCDIYYRSLHLVAVAQSRTTSVRMMMTSHSGLQINSRSSTAKSHRYETDQIISFLFLGCNVTQLQ